MYDTSDIRKGLRIEQDGIPFVVLFLPVSWIYLVKYFKVDGDLKGSSEIIDQEYHDLGPMSEGEKKVSLIILIYAMGFIFRNWWSSLLGVESFVKDSTVAFLASFFLFLVPSGRKDDEGRSIKLLEWKEAKEIIDNWNHDQILNKRKECINWWNQYLLDHKNFVREKIKE